MHSILNQMYVQIKTLKHCVQEDGRNMYIMRSEIEDIKHSQMKLLGIKKVSKMKITWKGLII